MIFRKSIEKIYRAQLYGRCDDKGNVYYFSSDDFEGLIKESYSFISRLGERLQGYFYSYEGFTAGRIIVFDHGYGGGHRSYMKEIEMLCRRGFRVFSYDHTGCMESEGESTRGFAQSLSDLDDCLRALKVDERYKNCSFSVVGHSWGAFSCLNISAFHPDVTHIVAMAGFISVKQMTYQNFAGLLKGYRKDIMAIERDSNPIFVDCNAVETLAETKARVLLIYSDNDPIVKRKYHYDVLRKALVGKENIRIILVQGKGHNPNYTEDAVNYLSSFSAVLTKKLKKKELESEKQKAEFIAAYDWDRMTAQDENIWAEIYKTLDEK